MSLTRRRLLLSSVFGAGLWGLRSLVTGLPKDFLLGQRSAHAAEPVSPQFLILSTSGAGDPLNANAPGALVTGAQGSPYPELAGVQTTLGSTTVLAGRAWSTLPSELRARMSFFHHRTYTNAHPEHRKVMTLHGAAKGESGNGEEMLASVVASEAAAALGTVQREPVPLGSERLSFEGRALDNIAPNDLKGLFEQPDDLLGSLTSLRDQHLDALYADLKANGTRVQRQFLDRFALGRDQVRQLGDQLAELLLRLPVDPAERNSAADQVVAAVALIKLRVAPVITLHLPFGGDNHNDADLTSERDQTIESTGTLSLLWQELLAQGLQDQVTFASLNVFGRTLKRNTGGGRNHNQHHHVMTMFGKNLRGGVVGGVEPVGNDFGAAAIDSKTGLATPDGDIGPLQSLEAAACTLWRALDLPAERMATRISGGKVVQAALRG